jgi:hypothetical protein
MIIFRHARDKTSLCTNDLFLSSLAIAARADILQSIRERRSRHSSS